MMKNTISIQCGTSPKSQCYDYSSYLSDDQIVWKWRLRARARYHWIPQRTSICKKCNNYSDKIYILHLIK